MKEEETQESGEKDKYSKEYFLSELTRAEKERTKFFKEAEESINVYSGNVNEQKLPDVDRRISIWWSIVNTLLPAYFSRVPKVDADLRKKSGDSIENLSAVAIERSTQYAIDEEMDFADEAYNAVLSYALTGQAIFWPRYDAATSAKTIKHELREEEGKYYYLDGSEYEGEEVEEDEEGGYYAEEEYEEKESEQVRLESVHYKDFLQSCARNQREVEWKAKRAYLGREEIESLFGEDVADGLKFNAYPEDIEKQRDDSINQYDGKEEIWEIWCKESNKVYWLNRNGNESDLFISSPPPVSYSNFWPCVELYSNIIPDSVIPIGDFTLVKDQILEVERLTTRIHAVTNAIRTNFAHDSALKELADLYTGDLKAIPVKDWPQHKTQGGLGGMVEFAPIQPYVQALDTLLAARDRALEKLYESVKASELMRGMSDPMDGVGTNQIKMAASNFQFGARQRQIESFFSKAIGKVAEIVSEHYDPQKLFEIANGIEIMEKLQAEYEANNPQPQPQQAPPPQPGQPPLPPAPMPPAPPPFNPEQAWNEIISLLRDDPTRRYRIEVASDSLINLDERAERQERVDFMASVGSFLGQIQQMTQQAPAIMPFAMNIMKFVSRSYKAGKELETDIEQLIGITTQQAQQQQSQGQQDKGGMEAQAKVQVAQIEAQGDQMKIQFEQSKLQADMQMKQQELQVKLAEIELEKMKLGQEGQLAQNDNVVKGLEMQLEQAKMQAQYLKEQMDTIQAKYKAEGI